MNKKVIAGSKEAVTGYEFQFTWTARRCISMLRHDSTIKQVCIESLDYEDEMDFGQGPETFLGVDTSEYYEGTTFNKATQIVISQLKCGISHPNKKWTISRICQKKKTKKSSVVGRLASAFEGIYRKKDPNALIEKLRLQIVSNCPLDTKARNLISKAQDLLKNLKVKPGKWQLSNLRKSSLTKSQLSEIEKLHTASGLGSNAFCVFLSCLNMTRFGVASPILQRRHLEDEIRAFDRTYHDNALLKLCDLIRESAKKGGDKITIDDVLSCFNTNKDNLLPAPCLIDIPSFVVETNDSENLAKLLIKSNTGKVLVHGEAGIGKSLTMKTVQKHLPQGSVSIVYDCYAGGETETPDKYRFPDTVLCTQLVNELSLSVGQNIYLIRNRTDQIDAWKTLQLAINKAAEKLRSQKSYLVLIIDAADNVVESFDRHKDHADYNNFVPTLWNVSLPENVRLVFTCRTFRKAKLNPPSDIAVFQLKGFTRSNSLEYLRSILPSANNDVGIKFHEKTFGVPRHQSYWLNELSRKKDTEAFNEIKQRKAFGLEELYNDWLNSAQTILPPKVPCKKIVGLLRATASPVSLAVISNCLGVDAEIILQFCQGLGLGIVFENSQKELRFRDEDYETFLDTMLNDDDFKSAHNTLAHHCLQTIEEGGYSSKYACMHLFKCGKYEELLAIVLGKSGINTIVDPIEKTNCERERINLAFKSATHLKNPIAALELLFEVGRINRTESLLSSTITTFPELIIRHNSYRVLEKSLLENMDDKNGNVYFRIASELSKNHEYRNIAESNLRKGEAWLRVHIAKVKKNNWLGFNYNTVDSVFKAISELNLYGPHAVRQVLRCWINPQDRLESLYQFFRQISTKYDSSFVLKVYNQCPSLALARTAAIAGMYELGLKPKRQEILYVASRLQKWLAKYGSKYQIIRTWIVPFLELAARSGVPKDSLSEITKQLAFSHNERLYHRLSANQWMKELDRYTQFLALKSNLDGNELSVEMLFPEDCAKIKSKERTDYSEEERAIKQIKSILPTYHLRSESFIKKHSIKVIVKHLAKLVDEWNSTVRYHWDRSEPLYEVFVLNAIHIIIKANGADQNVIDKLLAPCESIMGYTPCHLYMSVADILSYHEAYKDIALELIGKIKSQCCKSDVRASEVVQRLMKCSEILLRIDLDQSKNYFDNAMEAASGIDDDASFYLKGIANLSEHCANETSQETRSKIAVELKMAIEQYWPIMEEEEHIPWGEYIRAISALNSHIGLDAVFDMDAKGWLYIPRVSSELASGLIDGSQLDKVYALAFHEFGLLGMKYLENSLQVLQNSHASNLQMTNKVFDKLSNDIMRDAPLNDRANLCDQLVKWGNQHNMPSDIISGLKDCRCFYTTKENWSDSSNYQPFSTKKRSDPKKKWLKKIHAKNNDKLKISEDILKDKDLSAIQLKSLISEIGKLMRGSKRLNFIDKLVNYQSGFSYYSREAIPEVLNELVHRWLDTPGVSDWAQKNIPKYIEEHFSELLGYSYDYSLPVGVINLIENQVFLKKERANALLPALARNAQNFSPSLAYKIAGIIGKYVFEADIVSIVNKILKETVQKRYEIINKDGDGLAAFIYKCFGQPDNRMRWRAFYVVRHMLYFKPEPLLAELVNLSFSKEGQMWMSAREWLMFLFLHIAHKCPESLIPYASKIYEHAANKEFPHAGIQELAKRILLLLCKVNHSILTVKQKEYLIQLNEPRQTIWPRGERYIKSVKESKSQRNWRFHFNMFDTFPYWYSPLGRCFGLHRCDVAKRAERWICDVWNVTSEDCTKYSRKRERGYDWNLFSHSHGSHPTIETLSTYIERHAMFMAAGEMIRELPIIPADDDEYGSWNNWISRKCFDADPIITSDLRSPVPLKKFMHGITPVTISSEDTLPASIFVKQLYGHVAGSDLEWIVASGHYTVVISNYSVSVSVESALVSPKTARALARAMLSSEYVQSIGVPERRISYESNVEDIEAQIAKAEEYESYEFSDITENGFELMPFTTEYHTERNMHTMDPKGRGLSRTWRIPGKDFIEKLKLTRIPTQLSYNNNAGKLVVIPQSWEEGDYNQRYDHRTTYGHRLNILKAEIERYLKQVSKDLLVRIVIWKNKNNRDSSEQYDHGQAKIFILRQSGRIEAMGRNS